MLGHERATVSPVLPRALLVEPQQISPKKGIDVIPALASGTMSDEAVALCRIRAVAPGTPW